MFWIGFVLGIGAGMITLGVIACVMVSKDEIELMEEYRDE